MPPLSSYNTPQITNTFSIVARDKETGLMGVAVQSHYFSVGITVPWAETGVGAVATQAYGGVDFGPIILSLLKDGHSANTVMEKILKTATRTQFRQIAIVDSKGEIAAFTGMSCTPEAGHSIGEAVSSQGNVMINKLVWPAIKNGYVSSKGNFAERLVNGLEAGQKIGGDLRGQQSAAILIVSKERYSNPFKGLVMDLRVEDHPAPITELKRLLPLHAAHQLLNQARLLIIDSDFAKVITVMEQAVSLAPEKIEHKFYLALGLYGNGDKKQGLILFKEIFTKEPQWLKLIPRLASRSKMNANSISEIMAQGTT